MSDDIRFTEAASELRESGERFESCVLALAADDAGYAAVLRFIGSYRRMLIASRTFNERLQADALDDLAALERQADQGESLEEVLSEARDIATVTYGGFRAHRKLAEERMKGKEPI